MGTKKSINKKEDSIMEETPRAASNEYLVHKTRVSITLLETDLTPAEVPCLVSGSTNVSLNSLFQHCPICCLPLYIDLCTLQKCGHVYHKPCLLSKISQNSNLGVNKKALCLICEITQPNSDSFMDQAQILDVPLNLDSEMNFTQTQKLSKYLKFRAFEKSALNTS